MSHPGALATAFLCGAAAAWWWFSTGAAAPTTQEGPASSAAAREPTAVSAADPDPWRRTVRGWERRDEWGLPPEGQQRGLASAAPPPGLHPAFLAGAIVAVSVGALAWGARGRSDRAEHDPGRPREEAAAQPPPSGAVGG